MTDPRRHAPATQRNREAIAERLADNLPPTGTVLEIASGTGEHISYFAGLFPGLDWQPSEPNHDLRASIAAYREDHSHGNLAAPIALDTTERPWPIEAVDAVLCVNLLHIAPWSVGEALFAGAGEVLKPQSPLLIYGPFMRDGRHTAESNAAFDRSLRLQDPTWGVRDLSLLEQTAEQAGLSLASVSDMPANNFFLEFRRD